MCDFQSILLFLILFWFVISILFSCSTDMLHDFFSCRVSHLPWNIHKYVIDASLAMAEHNKYFVACWFLICCCEFPENFPPCIIQPAGQGIFSGPAGFFPALCDQLAKIAFPSGMLPRLWGSDVPTAPASLRHVTPWTVVAERNPSLGQDVLIWATASPFL